MILSYCAKNLEECYWSLEHDKKFAEITTNTLREHGLGDMATVIYAPLTETTLDGKNWLWYETKNLNKIGPIDLCIIDGPPKKTQKMARYPAMPLLANKLGPDAIIVLDDGSRKDVRDSVKEWLKKYRNFLYDWTNTEKGLITLRKIEKN
jgi:predicted O-methyltransferase YrrM